jgi:hypothetical protein
MSTSRLREAADEHLRRLLEVAGRTQSEAAGELATLAKALEREGNAE